MHIKFHLDRLLCVTVSELHGHLCPHCNVWPEAVYCCFIRTTLFTWLLWISISTQSFVAQLCLVIEIGESKLKKKNKNCENEQF